MCSAGTARLRIPLQSSDVRHLISLGGQIMVFASLFWVLALKCRNWSLSHCVGERPLDPSFGKAPVICKACKHCHILGGIRNPYHNLTKQPNQHTVVRSFSRRILIKGTLTPPGCANPHGIHLPKKGSWPISFGILRFTHLNSPSSQEVVGWTPLTPTSIHHLLRK